MPHSSSGQDKWFSTSKAEFNSLVWYQMAFVYKPGEFEEITKLYQNGKSLVDIQSLFPDKSVASIRMKLVKAGIYVAASKAVVAKQDSTSKGALPKLVVTPKPTTKAGIMAAYKTAKDAVGFASW